MIFEKPRRRKIEISLIPLINVIFLLVIFFLITGSMAPGGASQVRIPIGKTAIQSNVATFIVAIDQYNSIHIDGKYTPREELKEIIFTKLSNNKENNIIIKADEKLKAEFLTEIIKLIAEAGGVNISIATIPR